MQRLRIFKAARLAPVLIALFIFSCGDGLNLFTIQNDKDLGVQFDNEILADPDTYPVVSEEDYPEAYAFLKNVRDNILTSGEVALETDFDWPVRIIANDTVLNAFSTPGGYTYFYTGLMKFLANEDDLAGIMAHEMAHADKRHVTEALTRDYGLDLILSIVLGEDAGNALVGITRDLSGLAFSRDAESEADATSVEYLSGTEYACDSAATFFEKLIEEGLDNSPPEFLSSHPNPENRIQDIQTKAGELGCDTTPTESQSGYAAFKNDLP